MNMLVLDPSFSKFEELVLAPRMPSRHARGLRVGSVWLVACFGLWDDNSLECSLLLSPSRSFAHSLMTATDHNSSKIISKRESVLRLASTSCCPCVSLSLPMCTVMAPSSGTPLILHTCKCDICTSHANGARAARCVPQVCCCVSYAHAPSSHATLLPDTCGCTTTWITLVAHLQVRQVLQHHCQLEAHAVDKVLVASRSSEQIIRGTPDSQKDCYILEIFRMNLSQNYH